MKIVAMIDRSAGNESVGEMWTETKIFQEQDTLLDVYMWVTEKVNNRYTKEEDRFKCFGTNVKLSIAQ